MRQNELDKKTPPKYVFRAGEHEFSLCKDGVRCTEEEEGKERVYPYGEARIYCVVIRKSASNAVEEKWFLTAPAPVLKCRNGYRFTGGDKEYFTFEFLPEEKTLLKKAVEEYSVPVIKRERDLRGRKTRLKTVSEDGGLAHQFVVLSSVVFVLLVIGAVIMYLINHFLQTDTDTLALVFGIFCLPCIVVVLIKSQELGSKVRIYDKGVYLKIRSKSGYGGTTSPFAIEKAYFTWDEVEKVVKVQSQVQYQVQFRLGYRVVSVPDFYGLYDNIALRFPEKCGKEEA